MAQKPQQNAIPHYYLYGDAHQDVALDSLHIEPIRERSMRHDWIIHPHVHPDHMQVLMIAEGGATFGMEGEELLAEPESLVVIPAGVVHEIRFQPGTGGRVITVAVSYLNAIAREDPRLIDVASQPAVYPLAGAGRERRAVDYSLEQLMAESVWEKPGRRMATMAQFVNILVTLLRLRSSREEAAPSHRDRNFELVTRYRALLESHFRSEKSLRFYAGEMGVTTQRLNAACKARAGCTASEALYARIVIEAKRCLTYTEMSVTEIGHALGYDDPAYFNRFFSQRVGRSPGAYRAASSATQRVSPDGQAADQVGDEAD